MHNDPSSTSGSPSVSGSSKRHSCSSSEMSSVIPESYRICELVTDEMTSHPLGFQTRDGLLDSIGFVSNDFVSFFELTIPTHRDFRPTKVAILEY